MGSLLAVITPDHWYGWVIEYLAITWLVATGLRRFAADECPVTVPRKPCYGDNWMGKPRDEWPRIRMTKKQCEEQHWIRPGHVVFRDPFWAMLAGLLWPFVIVLVLPVAVFYGSFIRVSNLGRTEIDA